MTPRTDHPPSLVDAARALARARERVEYLRDLFPDNLAAVHDSVLVKQQARERLAAAEAALDAAYRREEYGEEAS